MHNTVASVITVLTSMDFVQKAHILYICTVKNELNLVIGLHNLCEVSITHSVNSYKFRKFNSAVYHACI